MQLKLEHIPIETYFRDEHELIYKYNHRNLWLKEYLL